MFLFHLMLSGQIYSFQQIKDSSFSIIKQQVGTELSQYFELAPKSMVIGYENWLGKNRIKWIEPDEEFKTKKLKVVSLLFAFSHPDLPSPDYEIFFLIDLDSTLSTQDTFDLFRIPAFILEGRPKDWLSQQSMQQIADTLSFEKKVQKVVSSITYDSSLKKYFFEVRNRYNSKDDFYFFEIYWINVVTGKIENHFYRDYYVCSTI